jgi:hypothetical protein
VYLLFLSIYTIWDRLSLKTISRYCPFNGRWKCTLASDWTVKSNLIAVWLSRSTGSTSSWMSSESNYAGHSVMSEGSQASFIVEVYIDKIYIFIYNFNSLRIFSVFFLSRSPFSFTFSCFVNLFTLLSLYVALKTLLHKFF